jgi:O-antigen ligase
MTGRTLGFAIIAFLIGGAALAFGSVEAWAEAWLRFGAVAACAAVLFAHGPREALQGPLRWILLVATLIVGFGALQATPLPAALVHAVSPRTARLKSDTLPVGGGAAMPSFLLGKAAAAGVKVEPQGAPPHVPADAGSRAATSSLSIMPYATRQACLAWLTPLLLGIAAATLARDRVVRYRLLWVVALWTGVMGAIALAEKLAGNGKLLWIRPTPTDAMPVGPFVNPNHFAAYVGLGLIVSIGLLLAILGGPEGRLSWRSARGAIMDRSWALPRILVLGSLVALAIAGLVLSSSRGGILGVAAGLIVLALCRRIRAVLPALAIAVVLAALAVGFISAQGRERQTLQGAALTARVDDASLDLRMDMWGRAYRILADHPVAGTGLGTFPWAYASYDREGEWLGTLQAHNDFLQLATETGVVGIGLLIALTAIFGWGVIAPALGRAGVTPPWTNAALVAAVFAMLVHSVIEFNFQIPAVASLFAVVAGLLVGAREVALEADAP